MKSYRNITLTESELLNLDSSKKYDNVLYVTSDTYKTFIFINGALKQLSENVSAIKDTYIDTITSKTSSPIYGIKIEKGNADPESCVTYTDDAKSMSPSTMISGVFTDNGWDKILSSLVGMKPCLLKDGDVVCYLDPNDYSKDVNGNSVDIVSGAAGDVMVEFTKCYVSWTQDDNYHYIKLSQVQEEGFTAYPFEYGEGNITDKFYIGAYSGYNTEGKLRSLSGKTPTVSQTIATFRNYARANGTGYELMPYNKLVLLQILYLLRFKSLNSQTALGMGNVNSYQVHSTGQTNTRGLNYGTTSDTVKVKCNGIEDFWGNVWEFAEGLQTTSSGQIMTNSSNFGSSLGVETATFTNTYGGEKSATDVLGGEKLGFLAKEGALNNNNSQYYYCCINWVIKSNCSVIIGGDCRLDSRAGVFNLISEVDPSYSHAYCGARLCYMG